ncbi:hypothetical protein [Lactococcus lactis]|uniref:hypothetical protein n=1 Tax=Lactococcus lactis TaxID=1358 RepID=UPI002072A6F9|nr:hypothetical protein [Lactococcus lactis]
MKISSYLNTINSKIPGWVKAAALFLAGYFATKLLDQLQFKSVLTFNPYKFIGRQEFDALEYPPFLVIVGMVFFGFLCVRSLLKKNYIFSLLLFIITILYIAVTPNTFAQYEAASYFKITNTNLKIIRPFISEKDYYEMQSDLYQIDTKQKFDDLDNKIKKVAKNSKANIYPNINN